MLMTLVASFILTSLTVTALAAPPDVQVLAAEMKSALEPAQLPNATASPLWNKLGG